MQLEDSSAFGAHPANCETAHIHLSTFEMEIVGTVAQLFLLRHVVVVGTQLSSPTRSICFTMPVAWLSLIEYPLSSSSHIVMHIVFTCLLPRFSMCNVLKQE